MKFIDHIKESLPKNWQQILAWIILASLSAVGARYGVPLPGPGPFPPPIFQVEKEWVQPGDGWRDDPDAVAEVAQSMRFAVFSDTPAGKSEDPLPAQVFLWDAYVKVTKALPPCKDQNPIGSCVAFGTNNAIMRTYVVSIALGGNYEYKDISQEVTYAGSRVQVGQGKISGDGSVGAWAAQFAIKWGIVPAEKIGQYDLTKYDPARCRAWGRSGVPAELQTSAKEHPVKDATLVKTWEGAKRALANGYGIAICSNQGFTMARDANGVCRPSGNWGHCMCLDGYCTMDGKEHGHIENSWGPGAHTGPVGPGGPSTAGFWASSVTISRMLAQGDSWAFSNVKGFPGRKIDWFVLGSERKPNRFVLEDGPALHWANLFMEGSYHAKFSCN